MSFFRALIFNSDEIEEARIRVIEDLLKRLNLLLAAYQSADYQCPKNFASQCGSFLCGALTRGLKSAGLLTPAPVRPFPNLRIQDIAHKLREIQTPIWHHPERNGMYINGPMVYHEHPCKLEPKVNKILKHTVDSIAGLSLSGFTD